MGKKQMLPSKSRNRCRQMIADFDLLAQQTIENVCDTLNQQKECILHIVEELDVGLIDVKEAVQKIENWCGLGLDVQELVEGLKNEYQKKNNGSGRDCCQTDETRRDDSPADGGKNGSN